MRAKAIIVPHSGDGGCAPRPMKPSELVARTAYPISVPRYLPHDPYAGDWGDPGNGLQIANKTGGWSGEGASMRADTALVEWTGTRYVVAIVTKGDPDTRFWPENRSDRLIGRISKLIFDHFGGAAVPPLASVPEEPPPTAG